MNLSSLGQVASEQTASNVSDGTASMVIAILLGIITNILTAGITHLFTNRRQQQRYEENLKIRNAEIASNAINHLYATYLATRTIRRDVQASHVDIVHLKHEPAVVAEIMRGLTRSLEQEETAILPNILTWRNFLPESSEAYKMATALTTNAFSQQAVSNPSVMPAISSITGPAGKNITASVLSATPTVSPFDHKHSTTTSQAIIEPRPLDAPSFTTAPSHSKPFDRIAERIKAATTSPAERVMRALVVGDIETLKTIKHTLSLTSLPRSDKLVVGAALAKIGDIDGAALVLSVYEDGKQSGTMQDTPTLSIIQGAVVEAALQNELEQEYLPIVQEITDKILADANLSAKQRASELNQLQRVKYGAKQYADALKDLLRVIDLNPSEPAYRFNAAVVYKELDDFANAEKQIDEMLRLGASEPEHLSLAVRVLRKRQRQAESDAILQRLSEIDPFHAQMASMGE